MSAPPLTSNSAGGVKLISGTRRITLDNTLDERLRLLEDRVRAVQLHFPCIETDISFRCYPRSAKISSEQTRTASSIRDEIMMDTSHCESSL